MKKILSVFAAAAVLFGFASCNGDLHDNVKAPIDLSTGYYLVGNMTGWNNNEAIAFEDNTEVPGTYVVKFQATEAEIAFAFIPELGSWNGQIGGNLMVGGTLPANAKYESKDNGNGGFNGTVSGLEVKANYKMVVTPNDDGTLKLDVSSNVPPTPVYLHNMYVRGAMVDWNPSVAGSLKFSNLDIAKGIVTYYVDFVCTDTAKNNFGIAGDTWDPKYVAAKITVDDDYVETVKNGATDNIITGLEKDQLYRIFVQTNPDETVFVKVIKLLPATVNLKFEVTGLSEGDEAWINGSFWGSDWPLGWAPESWNKPMKEGYAPDTADANGVATFPEKFDVVVEAEIGQTLSYAFKAIASNNAWKEVNVLSPKDDLNCKVKVDGDATYLVSVDAKTEAVTVKKQ